VVSGQGDRSNVRFFTLQKGDRWERLPRKVATHDRPRCAKYESGARSQTR